MKIKYIAFTAKNYNDARYLNIFDKTFNDTQILNYLKDKIIYIHYTQKTNPLNYTWHSFSLYNIQSIDI